MTSDELKEAIELIVEYARTKMLCYDERQRQLLCKYAQIMSKNHE